MAITRQTDPNGGDYAIHTSAKVYSPYMPWGPEGVTYSVFILKGSTETCRVFEIFKKDSDVALVRLDWGSDDTLRIVSESGAYYPVGSSVNTGWKLFFVKIYKGETDDRMEIYHGDCSPSGVIPSELDLSIDSSLHGIDTDTEVRMAQGTVGTFFDMTIWDKLLPQSLIEFKFNKNFTTLPPV